ncbi:glycosyltransferase [Alkalihalobacillus sp. FSL W8-0930]
MLALIIVMYEMRYDQSNTLNSLNELYIKLTDERKKLLKIIIKDNSVVSNNEYDYRNKINFPFLYINKSENEGLAESYTYCAKLSKEKYQKDWVVLLDQDTCLDMKYLNEVIDQIETQGNNEDIVALVPKIKTASYYLSPRHVNIFGLLRPIDSPGSRIYKKKIMAINSTSVIRLNFLESIGYFNSEFPLDYLDHWFYEKIYTEGRSVFILDSVLEHELSLDNMDSVSENRYRSYINSENKFYSNGKTRKEYLTYKVKLFGRIIKLLLAKRYNFARLNVYLFLKGELHD